MSGATHHLASWFGESVEVEVNFLHPAVVAGDLEAVGFEVMATVVRRPSPEIEYPSRRCYLLAQHSGQVRE